MVLNLVGQSYSDFFYRTRHVAIPPLILGMGDVSGHPDRNARMLVGCPIPTHKMAPCPDILWDVLPRQSLLPMSFLASKLAT